MSFPTVQVLWGIGNTPALTTDLRFDDPTNGLFDTGTFGALPYVNNGNQVQPVDVSTDLRSLSIQRGRQRQIEAFSSGSLSFVLDNNLGYYDPDNTASPYYISGATTIQPMTQITVTATWQGGTYYLFQGYVDSVTTSFAPGKYSDAWVTVQCSDGQKVLQNISESLTSTPEETSGNRIARILTAANWSSAARYIDVGDVLVQATTYSSSTSIWQDMQSVADAENGRLYMDTNGSVRFESRTSRFRGTGQTPVSAFKDVGTTGTDVLYSDVNATIDDDLIRNQVTVTRTGGVAQMASDATSLTQYQQRTFSLSGVPCDSDVDALSLAKLYIYSFRDVKGCRYDPVSFSSVNGDDSLWPTILGRRISDRVSVTVTPPNIAAHTVQGYIEQISHTVDVQPVQNWDTSYTVSRKSDTTFLIFDDPTYGILESTGNTFG